MNSDCLSRDTQDSVIAPQLLMLWKSSREPWGVKDLESRYLYANPAYYDLLNINPALFTIPGCFDHDLPSPVADFASHFQRHDRCTIKQQDRLCSIEIHCYGREKLIQPYFFDKYPLYHQITRECIGSIFHARKVEDVSLQKQLCGKSPGYFLFYPPEPIFTEGELDVIFFVLQNMSSKVIGRHLGLSHRTVENKLQGIYQKAGVHCLRQFSEYSRHTGFDRYVPQKFLKPLSQLLMLDAG
ncbi:helix-turn-helix transcriptional regulator [Sodalis sp. (in: enterobacteria)]|uniref:helix-turn-helix transcriptional regulator n=1 Tax=Sodalis sp. (in: enterobacteria) TaxID=1898979 RepID=UPI003F3AAED4